MLTLVGEKATLPPLIVCLAGVDAAVENSVGILDGFSSSSSAMPSTSWAAVWAFGERNGSAFSSLMMETRVRLFTRDVRVDGSWIACQCWQWQLRRWKVPAATSGALALLPSTEEAIVEEFLLLQRGGSSLFYESVGAWEGARVECCASVICNSRTE